MQTSLVSRKVLYGVMAIFTGLAVFGLISGITSAVGRRGGFATEPVPASVGATAADAQALETLPPPPPPPEPAPPTPEEVEAARKAQEAREAQQALAKANEILAPPVVVEPVPTVVAPPPPPPQDTGPALY